MRAFPWHRPLAIALSLVAVHVAGRAAFAGGVPDYRDVPRVTATDPAYFRARLAAAEQSVVRVAMFGDSQETAPWGWGEHYIAQLNARFARVFGPAGESQLFTNHTATSRPYWLGTMVEHAAAAPSALPDSAVLPSLAARALPAGGWSRTVFLHDASRCAHPPLQDGPWFDRTGPFVAEVLAVARAGAAPLAWRNAPVDGDEPDPLAPVVQSGFLAANPKDPKLGFLWRATPALSFAGRRHLQIALAEEGERGAAHLLERGHRVVGEERAHPWRREHHRIGIHDFVEARRQLRCPREQGAPQLPLQLGLRDRRILGLRDQVSQRTTHGIHHRCIRSACGSEQSRLLDEQRIDATPIGFA